MIFTFKEELAELTSCSSFLPNCVKFNLFSIRKLLRIVSISTLDFELYQSLQAWLLLSFIESTFLQIWQMNFHYTLSSDLKTMSAGMPRGQHAQQLLRTVHTVRQRLRFFCRNNWIPL